MKDRRSTIELVLDNVGTWKASKPGKQQHGQLGKHQLGTHKPNTWAGGTREAITIDSSLFFKIMIDMFTTPQTSPERLACWRPPGGTQRA